MSSTITCGAGSLDQDTKRHSRSLDLESTTRTVRHLHQRSASDGLDIFIATTTNNNNNSTEPIPTIPMSNSVFSLYKKLGSPGRNRSLNNHNENKRSQFSKSRASIGSAFSSFRQPSASSLKKSSNPRFSCVSSPVNNPDAAEAMNPIIKYNTISEEQTTLNEKKNSKEQFPSYLLAQTGDSKRSLPSSLQQEINQFAIDGFANKYFATHKRGLFRRAVPMNELLSWTKDSIKQPLLLSNKNYKDALKSFKTLQLLMHDRQRPRQFNSIETFQSLLNCGITKGQMRDEIYVQICRQLNKNPRGSSIRKGWEILCVISVTFPPSKNLESYLFHFVEQHHTVKANQVDIMSEYVSSKLVRICSRGARGKVLSAAEIERAMEAPFKPSVFGESLDVIMDQQKEDTLLKIPKIVTFLTNAVHELNGPSSEGIFRVPGDADAVTELRIRIENGNYDSTGIDDPNVPASLLKYWLRDLSEPLIPSYLYDECIANAHDKQKSIAIIHSLPEINRRIVLYMIRFLQDFADPKVIEATLMNVFNLAMVFAPNFLRCPSVNLTTIFENSKYEQIFLKTLINEIKIDKEACAFHDQL
ncbi:Rho GTPase activation protein [Helicostylum pulchrum]|nr:Rho GTPase activation protein [Helicostylum pulchrum]